MFDAAGASAARLLRLTGVAPIATTVTERVSEEISAGNLAVFAELVPISTSSSSRRFCSSNGPASRTGAYRPDACDPRPGGPARAQGGGTGLGVGVAVGETEGDGVGDGAPWRRACRANVDSTKLKTSRICDADIVV